MFTSTHDLNLILKVMAVCCTCNIKKKWINKQIIDIMQSYTVMLVSPLVSIFKNELKFP